jgi:peroxiredoxin
LSQVSKIGGIELNLKLKLNLTLKYFPGSLNTDVCDKKQDLYDSNNSYLQTACLISKELTYNRAEMYCKANGMELFDISSEESKSTLLDFAVSLFGEGSFLHVKGRQAGECQFIYNEDGSYEVLYGSCYQLHYLICGFKNPPVEVE